MEIFLKFLTYGAIGIAMVLSVLSYRLLSKEQEKEHVREPMLKSIRNYFFLSIILSLFFGATEIVTQLFGSPSGPIEDPTRKKIEFVYDKLLADSYADKNFEAKLNRIEYYVKKGIDSTYDVNCDELKAEINKLNKELENEKHGDYMDAVWSLNEIVTNDPNNFINIGHDIGNKDTHYNLLEVILEHSGKLITTISDRKTKIRESWKAFKKSYAILSEMNQDIYIVASDIKHLLKLNNH